MKPAKFISICITSFLLCLVIILRGYTDQIIYMEVSSFDPALSQFGIDVKGNMWVEKPEDGAINKTAFGAPGNNCGGEPYLVFKLPKVKAGESTTDGKTWAAWARLYIPYMLVNGNNVNSFLLRMSADGENWIPQTRGNRAIFWNDPMGESFMGQFPSNIPNDLTILTDVGTRLPWVWHKAWNGDIEHGPNLKAEDNEFFRAQVVLAVGDNYAEVGARESTLVDYPQIDIICFRNDGGLPSDTEAKGQLIAPVQHAGKATITWGRIKAIY